MAEYDTNGASRINTGARDAVRPGGPPPKKRGLRRWIWVVWLVVLVPVVYYAVQVFIVLMPRMRTERAVEYTMTESITAQGFVALDSTPVTAAGGVLYYTVPLGERVAAGSEVALVLASEEAAAARTRLDDVNRELALLEEARSTTPNAGDVEGYTRRMQGSIFEMLDVIDGSSYEGLEQAAGNVELAGNQLQVAMGQSVDFEARAAQLEAERQSLEARAVVSSTVTAPHTGFFVPATRNSRQQQSYDTLAGAAPAQLQQLLEQPAGQHGSDVAGYMVEDYKWSFFTVISLKEAEQLQEGAKLELAFPDVSKTQMPVVVRSITLDEAQELAKVELYCERMNADIMQLSTARAEIILRTEKGIRIDKNAMRIIEGERCVYEKLGNQVFKRKIEILLEDDNYLLLPMTYESGVNEVRLHDDIVVDSGGVELYDKKIL